MMHLAPSRVHRSLPCVCEVSERAAFYRQQCQLSSEVLQSVDLQVALHLIEETARRAGHFDAARELLDGTTGLGPR